MNRRGFLTALAAIAATAVVDPERALWIPGKKLISIPRPSILVTSGWGGPPIIVRLGDILTFGADEQRYVVVAAGEGFVELSQRYPIDNKAIIRPLAPVRKA